MKEEKFPKSRRILRKKDFLQLKRVGRKITARFLWAYTHSRGEGLQSRLGLGVSKRVAKAVMRNRLKRITREYFRRKIAPAPIGADLLIVVRASLFKDHSSSEDGIRAFKKSLLALGKRIGGVV